MNLVCTHPKYAVYNGYWNESGKRAIKFISKRTFENIESGVETHYSKDDLLLIPCGRCVACRMRYSYQWANRLMLELSLHDPNKCWFVTLTYDDDHISLCRPACDYRTGECIDNLWSLEKRHLQLFLKRLRKKMEPDKIRFYASGEYGSKNHRCHFHLILFNLNLPLSDLHFLKKSKLNFDYFTSDIISEVWSYGFNVVTPVSWENCSYTARYMLKKMKGLDSYVYNDFGLAPPFSESSRKPGIAKGYYDNISDFSKVSYLVAGAGTSVRRFAPPSYFEKLFEKECPEEAEFRKEKRKEIAKNLQLLEMSGTDKSREFYLLDLENALDKKDNILYNYRDL